MTKQGEVTLLLVEDDDIDAMTVQRGLSKQRIGNQVIRAKDGLEALSMMQQGIVKAPYIVLLDLQMPRMNGVEFLQTIRKTPELAHTVVFVLTTSNDEQDILASYAQNISGYFVKDEVGSGFAEVLNMLDGYWKIVHLPTQTNN